MPAEIAFPAPHRFRLPGGLEAIGYEGEVVYPLLTDVAAETRGNLRAAVDYVACAVECIPFHDELQLTLDPADAGGADEQLLRQWLARVPRARADVALAARLRYSTAPRPELEIELAGPPLAGADPELFLEPSTGATFGPAVRNDRGEAMVFRAPVLPETAGRPPLTLRVAWTVTGLRAGGTTIAAAGRADVPATSAGPRRERSAGRAAAPRRASAVIALLALPVLALALLAWTAPDDARPRRRLLQALGFVAAAGLVWGSYRLASLLPAPRLAGLQLSWLGVALAFHSAMRSAGARRVVWWLLAASAATLGVWLAASS